MVDSLWGSCEKHKISLQMRYCENGKPYNYCSECERENADRINAMFQEKEPS